MPSRRAFCATAAALAATAVVARGEDSAPAAVDIHQHILQLARAQEAARRARFAAVHSVDELVTMQRDLRAAFLSALDGLPTAEGPSPARVVGTIKGDGYRIEKLIYQSFPNYHVPALLYLPEKVEGEIPGILSPCGHSTTGKAADSYQTLHINLARRGFAVLTYDPVGQGERSQYWDAARKRSRYNLTCGEHAVLGNPLYLLGTSLARYRIWDGMRGIDYLAAHPAVDAARIGCVGNSGGGTLTAYIAALDPRVQTAVISCYITTLPRRMANRIEADPDADPEQDIFGFVSAGIDHAGLLALRAPRPTLVCSAEHDFFPLAGAKESSAEARRLFALAGAENKFAQAVAPEKHGLTLPLREAAYAWFDTWLADRPSSDAPTEKEIPVKPRPAEELLVCPEGQVSVTYRSRHLLALAAGEFRRRPATPKRSSLRTLLRLAEEQGRPKLATISPGEAGAAHLVFIDGNESPAWESETKLLQELAAARVGATSVSPRGVGPLRPNKQVAGKSYADPLCGVEENIAYNAFLVGRSLLGARVADVLAAVAQLRERRRPKQLILVGRGDAALVACLAAAVEPAVTHLATEGLLLSYWSLFSPDAPPTNAASILPNLLRDYGDIPDLLAAIAPRPILIAAPRGKLDQPGQNVRVAENPFSATPMILLDWLRGANR